MKNQNSVVKIKHNDLLMLIAITKDSLTDLTTIYRAVDLKIKVNNENVPDDLKTQLSNISKAIDVHVDLLETMNALV